MKRKNIALCILITILTCGIYMFFWLVSIANSVNKLENYKKHSNPGGVMVLLFTMLTCGIYGVYWSYKTGERIDGIKNYKGIPTSNNTGILYLFLRLVPFILSGLSLSFDKFFGMGTISNVTIALGGVFGILLYCLMQNEINNLIDAE